MMRYMRLMMNVVPIIAQRLIPAVKSEREQSWTATAETIKPERYISQIVNSSFMARTPNGNIESAIVREFTMPIKHLFYNL